MLKPYKKRKAMDSAMLGNGLVLNQITPPVHPSHKRGHLVRRKHPKKSKEVTAEFWPSLRWFQYITLFASCV